MEMVYTTSDSCLQEDLQQESLQKQFKIVQTETKTSHVQEFGNMVSLSSVLSWPAYIADVAVI